MVKGMTRAGVEVGAEGGENIGIVSGIDKGELRGLEVVARSGGGAPAG